MTIREEIRSAVPKVALALSIAILPEAGLAQARVKTASIAQFEMSNFFVKYKLVSKDRWSLRTGGTNFSYSFADTESGRETLIEMGPAAASLSRLGVSWNGLSTSQPARLTSRRQAFLTDLLSVCFPDIRADSVVALVKTAQGKNYPGGSNTIPRTRVGLASVYVGTVGETLIVGIER